MIWNGLFLIIFGFACINISSNITKKYIRKNNPSAYAYTAMEMKAEWQRVAKQGGVVPSWVSLIGLVSWFILIVGVYFVVKGFLE